MRSSWQLTTPKTWKFAEAGAGQPQIGDAMRPASVTQQDAHVRKFTPSRALPFASCEARVDNEDGAVDCSPFVRDAQLGGS
jgi:hypothetical protein